MWYLPAKLQMFVPRAAADGEVRPFIVSLAELDLLLEPKPEGRVRVIIHGSEIEYLSLTQKCRTKLSSRSL